MLKIKGFPRLFGKGRLIEDETFSYSQYNTINVAGAPAGDYPEGTIFINTADNRIYMAITGSTAVDTPTIAWWKFDESSGNAADSSGNSHTATNGSLVPYVAGKYGKAIDCNGTDDYFTTASHADFNQNGNFTIEFWANLDVKNVVQVVVRRYADANNLFYLAFMNTGVLQYYHLAQAVASNIYTSLDSEATGEYHHYAIVGDRAADSLKIYIDGVLRETSTINDQAFAWGANVTSIGADDTGANYQLNGRLDDLKWFSTVRTQSQILSDMAESGGSASGTSWLYWDMIPA
jgi:hypothetical protein